MLIFCLFLIYISIAILAHYFGPALLEKSAQLSKEQAKGVVGQVDRYMEDKDVKLMYQITMAAPIALGLAALFFLPSDRRMIGLVAGVILGFLLPRMYVSHMIRVRKEKFNDQLMDTIMIMSSSFRGGLSLVQAIESVVDEMSEPSKGEFGIVLGENKMGVGLDESLNRLYKRMPSPAMQQMVTAVLLARETGGNLPVIFSRIVNSTRERNKIEKDLQTLTVQGKIQAIVMTGLPVFFFFTVSASNPHFFDIMLHSPIGQQLLIACVILWLLGAISIWRICTYKDM